ncbi:hypothetical protein MUG91_G181n10 [Manis pentadactyla]|nr:hypothetical protein MUG91_G181n10 [Manis pentadactyla]
MFVMLRKRNLNKKQRRRGKMERQRTDLTFYDYTFQMTEKEEATTTMFLTSADLPHVIKHFSKISLVEHDV